MAQNLIGQTISQRYRVDTFIAATHRSTTYLGHDIQDNTPLSMRQLHFDKQENPTLFERISSEAETLQQLEHDNILPCYGLHQQDDDIVLLERYIDGPAIKQILEQSSGKPMPYMAVLSCLKALSAALTYWHEKGIVHGTVTPDDVILDHEGHIYLANSRITQWIENTYAWQGTQTVSKHTPPEASNDNLSLTPASDIYSLGVILYEMLTGQTPFADVMNDDESNSEIVSSSANTYRARLDQNPAHPVTLNPALPATADDAILKALATQPQQRQQSARELYEELCRAFEIVPDAVPDAMVLPAGINYSSKPPAIAAVTKGPLQRLLTARLSGGKALVAAGSLMILALLLACGIPTCAYFLGQDRQQTTGMFDEAISLAGDDSVIYISETPLPSLTPTSTPLPSPTPLPSATPLPTRELTLIEKMKGANILVYEEAWGAYDLNGRALDKRIDHVLDEMELTGRNVVRDHDALGDFLEHLNSDTEWDLIIVSAENRSYVRGELWEAIAEHVENSNTALIAEIWYLDQIHVGSISPLLDKCGIAFQKDWTKDPGINPRSSSALNSFIVHALEPNHPIFTNPNRLKRGGLIVPSTNYFVGYDVGDLMEISGSGDAKLLAGTHADHKDSYGVIAECMEGRILWVTMGSHDFKRQDIEDLWENYIVYTLKNHYSAE